MRLCGFKSRPRHHKPVRRSVSQPPGKGQTRRRSQAVKAEVCKTSMRRFESARRLHPSYQNPQSPVSLPSTTAVISGLASAFQKARSQCVFSSVPSIASDQACQAQQPGCCLFAAIPGLGLDFHRSITLNPLVCDRRNGLDGLVLAWGRVSWWTAWNAGRVLNPMSCFSVKECPVQTARHVALSAPPYIPSK